ncbi:MAG: hypothetical protein ACFFD4_16970 [Candidatus Odinarchaeota archaeon]
MIAPVRDEVRVKLSVFCLLCHENCDKFTISEIDRILFDNSLKILQDDLTAFFEYLRLHSPLEKVICNFRSFIYQVASEKKQLQWHDRKEKRFLSIPPSVFAKYFVRELKRWKYDIPKDFSPIAVEQALGMIDIRQDRNIQNSAGSFDRLLGAQNSYRFLETDCPLCGEVLKTELDDNDLENLKNGSRVLHKAVKHGSSTNSHVVDLYIDSDYNIRRIHAAKLVKALH